MNNLKFSAPIPGLNGHDSVFVYDGETPVAQLFGTGDISVMLLADCLATGCAVMPLIEGKSFEEGGARFIPAYQEGFAFVAAIEDRDGLLAKFHGASIEQANALAGIYRLGLESSKRENSPALPRPADVSDVFTSQEPQPVKDGDSQFGFYCDIIKDRGDGKSMAVRCFGDSDDQTAAMARDLTRYLNLCASILYIQKTIASGQVVLHEEKKRIIEAGRINFLPYRPRYGTGLYHFDLDRAYMQPPPIWPPMETLRTPDECKEFGNPSLVEPPEFGSGRCKNVPLDDQPGPESCQAFGNYGTPSNPVNYLQEGPPAQGEHTIKFNGPDSPNTVEGEVNKMVELTLDMWMRVRERAAADHEGDLVDKIDQAVSGLQKNRGYGTEDIYFVSLSRGERDYVKSIVLNYKKEKDDEGLTRFSWDKSRHKTVHFDHNGAPALSERFDFIPHDRAWSEMADAGAEYMAIYEKNERNDVMRAAIFLNGPDSEGMLNYIEGVGEVPALIEGLRKEIVDLVVLTQRLAGNSQTPTIVPRSIIEGLDGIHDNLTAIYFGLGGSPYALMEDEGNRNALNPSQPIDELSSYGVHDAANDVPTTFINAIAQLVDNGDGRFSGTTDAIWVALKNVSSPEDWDGGDMPENERTMAFWLRKYKPHIAEMKMISFTCKGTPTVWVFSEIAEQGDGD